MGRRLIRRICNPSLITYFNKIVSFLFGSPVASIAVVPKHCLESEGIIEIQLLDVQYFLNACCIVYKMNAEFNIL